MFWLITNTNKYSAQVSKLATSVFQGRLVSAYTYQNIKATLAFANKLQLGSIKSGLKFAFTTENLPKRIERFNPIYQKIRWRAIKVGKIAKSVIMSKKVSAALTALSTVVLVTGLGMTGLPVILLPTIAAIGTYAQEKRAEQLKEQIELAENQLINNYEYTQTILNISLTSPNINNQQLSYKPPSPVEIVKAVLDLTLTGILKGVVSIGFMSKVGSYGYSAYSEINQYYKISSLKSKFKDSQISEDKAKSTWSSKFPKSKSQKWKDKIKSSKGGAPYSKQKNM